MIYFLNEGLHADDPLKVRSYRTEVHQIYKQCSQTFTDELLKSERRYCNTFRNARATNKGGY